MTQVVMHVSDEGAEGFLPAYSVCVAGGRAFVRPLRDEWAETARGLEQRLNRQDLAGSPALATGEGGQAQGTEPS
jgi:hypothetical protein